MSIRIPAPHRAPERKEAVLVNCFGQATIHRFERAEVRPILRGEKELGVAFLWRCTETGEIRRYGCEYLDHELKALKS